MVATKRRITMAVCLSFTLTSAARADSSQGGPTARVGTTVGSTTVGEERLTTLGVYGAAGYQLGRFALEAEYSSQTLLEYIETEGGNQERGELDRLAVTARITFASFVWPRSKWPYSTLQLYGDLGTGLQRGTRSSGEGFTRSDLAVGGGLILNHRSAHLGAPSIGWYLGWQVIGTPGAPSFADSSNPLVLCKGCAPHPRPPPQSSIDLGLVLNCAMQISF